MDIWWCQDRIAPLLLAVDEQAVMQHRLIRCGGSADAQSTELGVTVRNIPVIMSEIAMQQYVTANSLNADVFLVVHAVGANGQVEHAQRRHAKLMNRCAQRPFFRLQPATYHVQTLNLAFGRGRE